MSTQIEISAVSDGAWRAVFEHRGAAARLALQAAIAFVPVLAVSTYALRQIGNVIQAGLAVGSAAAPSTVAMLYLVAFAPLVLLLLILVPVAVSWQRLILLGEQPTGVLLRLDRATWSYLKYVAACFVCMLVITGLAFTPLLSFTGATLGGRPVPAPFNLSLIAIGGTCLAFYASIRLWVGNAARACGIEMTLSEAWSLSQGNTARIFGAAFLAAIPIALANQGCNLLTRSLPRDPMILMLASSGLTFLTCFLSQLVNGGTIAGIYQQLTSRNWIDDEAQSTTTAIGEPA